MLHHGDCFCNGRCCHMLLYRMKLLIVLTNFISIIENCSVIKTSEFWLKKQQIVVNIFPAWGHSMYFFQRQRAWTYIYLFTTNIIKSNFYSPGLCLSSKIFFSKTWTTFFSSSYNLTNSSHMILFSTIKTACT